MAYLTIIGFGSLLSEKSARYSCPGLKNFRKVKVKGFQRIFNMTSYTTLEYLKGDDRNSLEFSTCNLTKNPTSTMLCTAFEFPEDQWKELKEREFDYQHPITEFKEESGKIKKGILCVGYNTDSELFQCNGRKKHWDILRKKLDYHEPIIRTNILPGRLYLKLCIESAKKLGDDYLNNFLDESMLGDGKTTIREYIDKNPDILTTPADYIIPSYK